MSAFLLSSGLTPLHPHAVQQLQPLRRIAKPRLEQHLPHPTRASIDAQTPQASSSVRHPRLVIDYCTGCRWGLRAGWMAQELLVTFEGELGEVALRPGTRSGVFDVWINADRVWCREEMRRFPELKELKQLVRDAIVPDRSLGHSDK